MEAFWIDSGDARVFGMLHEPPAGRAADSAVVLCPPLGYQGVCSYRPLRALALELAASGRPTLRFDWPASGESTGSERVPALVARWVAAVAAAADETRRRTGARQVALVGVKIGATLAAVAAAEGANVSELVLWAPTRSGKAYMRETRAFQRLAARTYPRSASAPPALPEGAEEASGFLISAETVRDLIAVDLTELRWAESRVQRVLVAGTETVAPDEALLGALSSSGIQVDVATLPGVDGMLEDPNTSKVPADAFGSILSWLSVGEPTERSGAGDGRGCSLTGKGWTETVVQLDSHGTSLVGTVTRATMPDAGTTWVLLPSAGPVRRMGPNRLWTRFARAWATRGVSSLRLDIRGVGDSGGPDGSNEHVERLYSPESIDDVAVGIEYLRDHVGASRFAVVGLCSGAFAGFHTAARREDVVAAVLVNPQVLFWDTNERDLTQWAHMVRRSQWRRLLSGQLTVGGVLRAPRGGWRALVAAHQRRRQMAARRLGGPGAEGVPERDHGEAVVDALGRIAESGTALAFVYSLGDPGLTYLERQLRDSAGTVTRKFGASLDIVNGADHTFRPLWTQDRLQMIVEGALERAGVFGAPSETSGAAGEQVTRKAS